MNITPQDAAAALSDIDKADMLSRELKGYQVGGPYLIIWGLAWLAAGTLTGLMPAYAWVFWNTVNFIAVCATIWLTYRSSQQDSNKGRSWRVFGAAFTMAAYVNGSLWLFKPESGHQIEAFIGLAVATGYVLLGIWHGQRYVIAGLITAAVMIGGYIYLRDYYSLWMGIVGGGSMILCGVWMRRA